MLPRLEMKTQFDQVVTVASEAVEENNERVGVDNIIVI
jgi:hypothetical protein